MDINQLPPEVIQCIGDCLRRAALNALVQTSKRHAIILTPLLYEKAFRRHFRAPTDAGPESRARSIWVYSRGSSFVSQRRLWSCAPYWDSEYVMKYFMNRSLEWANTRFGGRERNGATWLHQLAAAGHEKLLWMFLQKGLDIRSRDWDGNTVLHSAAAAGQTRIFYFLFRNGLDVLDLNYLNQSVLVYSLTRNKYHQEALIHIIDAVKARGGDLNSNLDTSRTPPIFLATKIREALPVIKHFLDNGVNVFQLTGPASDSLLHWAARFGHEEIGGFLVSRMKSRPEFFTLLNAQRQTPLHLAIQTRRWSLTKTLIAAGANLEFKDGLGRTALDMAIYFRCLPILEDIIKRHPSSSMPIVIDKIEEYLWRSIKHGDPTAVFHLVALQSTCKIRLQLPTLHHLIEAHQNGVFSCEIIEIIGEAGANFHSSSRPYFETPLHTAIRKSTNGTSCSERTISYLLVKTNNLSLLTRQGNSILHYAARYGSLNTVELILKDPGMTAELFALENNAGNTALHEAVKRSGSNKKMVKLLMQAREEFYQRSVREKICARSPRKIGKPAVPDPPVRGERKENSNALGNKSINARRSNGNANTRKSLNKIMVSRRITLRRESAEDGVSSSF